MCIRDSLKAFDLVLEKYAENNKTPVAMYMKGMALLKLGRRTEAARQFQDVADAYPGSEQAAKAKVQIKNLGLSTTRSRPKKK